jgi:decaprenyl-phosphate phosphoribosyltransferase
VVLKTLPYVKLMRVDHWIKNLFMLPGVAIAFSFNSIPINHNNLFTHLQNIMISFIALCVASSANYTINEWLDRDLDRIHPFKKHRIAGQYKFSSRTVYIQYAGLVMIVLMSFRFQSVTTNLFLGLLLFMGVLYNVEPIRLKDKPYLDVISESLNNPIRLAIGWYAVVPNTSVPASAFVSFWGVGVFLMSLKRYSEMVIIDDLELLGRYRKSFLFWTPEKLLVFSFAGGLIALSFIGILLVRYRVEYVLVLPFLIWIFSEYLKISLKLDPASFAPEKLMKKSRIQILAALVASAFLLFTFLDIAYLHTIIQ